jgi:hypothetical protein
MVKNKKRVLCYTLSLGLYSGLGQAIENWSVQKQLNLPNWLTLKIDHRTRYEGYDSAFKKNGSGGDQVIAFRTNVFLGVNYNNFELGAEFIDSRITLAGSNTPMNTSLINQTDLLQAYLAWKSNNFLNSGLNFKIKAGRQTMDVGSRRLIARNRFRNTINNFTGFDTTLSQGDWHWRNFVVLPVSRLPNDKASLRAGKTAFDQEDFERIFAGTFFSMKNLPLNSTGELYGYYLSEDDTHETRTKNRKLLTYGFRWFRKAKTNQFDFEIETALQTGTSRASSSTSDTKRLNHFAGFGHAAIGYSFDTPWKPQIMLQYDYASGDKNPNDNENNRFETLYGARRFEFGPTSIWGAFARANINSPGIRLKFKPHKTITGFIAHRAYWLAQSKDSWTGAKIRDVTGNSGAYIGQQMEMRLRWQAIPKTLQFETGWAHLFKGSFAKNAPNAPSNKSDVDYFYFQTSLHI